VERRRPILALHLLRTLRSPTKPLSCNYSGFRGVDPQRIRVGDRCLTLPGCTAGARGDVGPARRRRAPPGHEVGAGCPIGSGAPRGCHRLARVGHAMILALHRSRGRLAGRGGSATGAGARRRRYLEGERSGAARGGRVKGGRCGRVGRFVVAVIHRCEPASLYTAITVSVIRPKK
jgi:hypothetical protein